MKLFFALVTKHLNYVKHTPATPYFSALHCITLKIKVLVTLYQCVTFNLISDLEDYHHDTLLSKEVVENEICLLLLPLLFRYHLVCLNILNCVSVNQNMSN